MMVIPTKSLFPIEKSMMRLNIADEILNFTKITKKQIKEQAVHCIQQTACF
jgi:hypothetical protein